MIAPTMATMLAFLATNAPMSREALRDELREASEVSFNMISVDGDMSTNDACYAFAPPGDGPAPNGFRAALRAVTRALAIAMVTDGEGATKTLTVEVTSARDDAQARAVARAIVNSNLVKTALYGEDPNWGRIVAAAGSVRAGIDPEGWSLFLGGKPWVARGAIELLSEAESHRELEGTSVGIRLDLGTGEASATAWGCDLSKDYVRINARYRT
jgi:glutamate N-acetyltransferase/amino-acid N-acetyltransferase